jgi:hypothetical protein
MQNGIDLQIVSTSIFPRAHLQEVNVQKDF